jgi:hypothetical protein
MMSHNEIFSDMMRAYGLAYLKGVCCMKLRDSENQDNRAFIPKQRKNKDTEKIAAYYRFTTTELDMEASTFKQAIENKKYVKDECFINSIYDFYHENLLRANKSRNVINRQSILETIGKTEENVKEGLSIEDVLPFFKTHRLHLRVYDKFYKLVAKYDPPVRNHNHKTMFCMMSDGHVYTLNHDIKRLEQQADESDNYTPTVNDSYYINEDAKPRAVKMISSIDDILQVLRDLPPPADEKEKQVLNLIRKNDDLVGLLFSFIQAGYTPGINFESGRVMALKLELNKVFCIIQSQQLVKSAIDGAVVVDSEEVYNRMSEAMSNLTKTFSQKPLILLHG